LDFGYYLNQNKIFMKNLSLPRLILPICLLSFHFSQCSVKNLEDQLPFSLVEKDFQAINLPVVKDPGLEIAQAPKPTLLQSESAKKMILNIDSSSDPSQLTQETKSKVQVTNYLGEIASPILRLQMLMEIERMNEVSLGLVFFGKATLDPDMSTVVKTVMNSNQYKDLFAKVLLPEMVAVSRVVNVTAPKIIVYKTSPPKGNCGKAAQEALDRAIRRLQESREAQLNTIETNLKLRVEEANQRFSTRNVQAEQNYQQGLKNSAEEVSKLLRAAQRMSGKDPRLAEELRLLAMTMAVANQLLLKEEYDAALQANILARDNEIKLATLHKQELESEINSNFNTEYNNAIATLERVLEACHNQGGGN
jgi:hypothetical protein